MKANLSPQQIVQGTILVLEFLGVPATPPTPGCSCAACTVRMSVLLAVSYHGTDAVQEMLRPHKGDMLACLETIARSLASVPQTA